MCNFGSRIKVCIIEFREFIIVMPNLNYDIPQDFEENEIRSEFARTRMQIISIQIKEINSSIAAKLLKVEIKKSEKDKR